MTIRPSYAGGGGRPAGGAAQTVTPNHPATDDEIEDDGLVTLYPIIPAPKPEEDPDR